MEASPPEPSQALGHGESCPLCHRDNQCRVAKGHLYKGPCWCHRIIVPGHILSKLAEDFLDPACFCRPCLETIARISREQKDTASILAEIRRVLSPAPS